jgi:Regulator of chromosome condensation (RCC1) repeat
MVKGLTEVTAVAGANEHALALTRSGKVYAWGANNDGMLGRGVGGFEGESGIDSRIPNEVPGLSEKVKAIAVGGASDYALLQGGEVEAWGQNSDGKLGVAWNPECEKVSSGSKAACKPFICKTGGGNQLCETSPQPVVYSPGHPIANVVAIAAGSESAYALLENGHVLSWGSNKQGALGQPGAEIGAGAKFIAPGEVQREAGLGSEALDHVTELSAGAHHALALVEGGAVLGWGSGEEGALGELPPTHPTCGSKTPCLTQATPIKGLEGVTAETVAAGKEYSLVLSGARVYAFGRDDRGELANGTTSETGDARPAISTKLDGAVEIAAGPTHGLALVAEPPAPHIVVHREVAKIRFSWWNEVGFEANHLNYHEFERPGLTEPEEGGGEECGGEGEGLYPKTCPSIKHEPASSSNLTTTEQLLVAKSGAWHGAEPIKFSYQWQVCAEPVEAACSNIGAGEKGTEETYKATETELGEYIRLLVTAEDVEAGEAQSVTAASELTTRVQKAKAKESTVYSVSIKKEEEKHEISDELALPQAGHSGEPSTLGEVPWEFKLGFESKSRWFVATPE